MLVKVFSSFIIYSCLHPAEELIERRDITKTVYIKCKKRNGIRVYTLYNVFEWLAKPDILEQDTPIQRSVLLVYVAIVVYTHVSYKL